jgi:Cytochrome c554 and c-prime
LGLPRSAATVLGVQAFAPTLVIATAVTGSVASPARPADTPTFVGSAACGSCHESQMAAWRGSQHALAMQEATAERAPLEAVTRPAARQ